MFSQLSITEMKQKFPQLIDAKFDEYFISYDTEDTYWIVLLQYGITKAAIKDYKIHKFGEYNEEAFSEELINLFHAAGYNNDDHIFRTNDAVITSLPISKNIPIEFADIYHLENYSSAVQDLLEMGAYTPSFEIEKMKREKEWNNIAKVINIVLCILALGICIILLYYLKVNM